MIINIVIKIILVFGVFISFITFCTTHRLKVIECAILIIFAYIAYHIDQKFILNKKKRK